MYSSKILMIKNSFEKCYDVAIHLVNVIFFLEFYVIIKYVTLFEVTCRIERYLNLAKTNTMTVYKPNEEKKRNSYYFLQRALYDLKIK